jgi:hypothetical protein
MKVGHEYALREDPNIRVKVIEVSDCGDYIIFERLNSRHKDNIYIFSPYGFTQDFESCILTNIIKDIKSIGSNIFRSVICRS